MRYYRRIRLLHPPGLPYARLAIRAVAAHRKAMTARCILPIRRMAIATASANRAFLVSRS